MKFVTLLAFAATTAMAQDEAAEADMASLAFTMLESSVKCKKGGCTVAGEKCACVHDMEKDQDGKKTSNFICAPEVLCGQTVTVEEKDITIGISCFTAKSAVKILAGAASVLSLTYAM